jgi:hypothetical protein
MGYFSVRVVYSDGEPAEDIGIMIYYDVITGYEEKRTDSDGWVEFHNDEDSPGEIWVHCKNMGSHSLDDGKTYSFTI